jgi:hypothetical protein
VAHACWPLPYWTVAGKRRLEGYNVNRKSLLFAALLAASLASSSASAITFELLYSPCWTGSETNIDQDNGVMGMYRGAIDCFNKDFNGGGARTILSLKHFQPWEFGSMFMYYDITGPFNGAYAAGTANEKGGFFGGITFALSAKKIAQKITGKEYNWGLLWDVSLKYEMEHVSKWGMIHYYGLSYDLAIPWMDFVSAQTVVRNDTVFKGVDLQIGLAWQKSFTLLTQDFVFDGFIAWGVFGEGEDIHNPANSGIWFIVAQPQFMWDLGKLVTFTPGKLYLGLEYQIAFNRYLIPGKTENVLSGMIHWNL